MSSDISSNLISSIIFAVVYGVISIIKCGGNNTINCLCIPVAGGKGYLQKNLDFSGSNYSGLIDLDVKVKSVIPSALLSHSEIDADLFKKAKDIVSSTIEILGNTSNSSALPIICSRNYKMLKYAGLNSVVNYYLGSASYYESVKLSSDDTKLLNDYKEYLNNNGKSSKLIVYNTKEELLSLVSKKYGLKSKK